MPSTICYRREDGVKLERELRVGNVEDIFFMVERESRGFQIRSFLWISNLVAEGFFLNLLIKEDMTRQGQACGEDRIWQKNREGSWEQWHNAKSWWNMPLGLAVLTPAKMECAWSNQQEKKTSAMPFWMDRGKWAGYFQGIVPYAWDPKGTSSLAMD